MLFHSAQFLIFFPIVTVLYYAVPGKLKHAWLLAASYYFYMCWNARHALLILFSTVVTYAGALCMERVSGKGFRRLILAASLFANPGVLFLFKYSGFAVRVASLVFQKIHIQRKSSDFKYRPFFEQEEDFDIIFLGTSHVINGIFPMELWKDYGLVSYNFGGHGNELAVSYWVLKNVLDYTNPKLVVIDCLNLGSQTKTGGSFDQVHLSMDAFAFSMTKWRAASDLLDDAAMEANIAAGVVADAKKRTRMSLIWDYSVYHARWNEISAADYGRGSSREKGAESRIAVSAPAQVEKIAPDKKLEGDTAGVQYLCRKVTDYLGAYIRAHYALADHREDKAYSSWHESYADYERFKAENLKSQQALDVYLMLLADKNYHVFLEIRNPAVWKNKYYRRLLENLGIDRKKVKKNTDCIVVQSAAHADYLSNFAGCRGTYQTGLGDVRHIRQEGGSRSIYLDNQLLYTVPGGQDESTGLRIAVFDKNTMELIDHAGFGVQGKDGIAGDYFAVTGVVR